MANIYVKWTGEWPRKCKGRWEFEVDGEDCRYLLPFANDDGFDLPADTEGTYERWEMDSEGEKEWYHYEDGLDIDEWIDQNREWLETITLNEEAWDDIFFAFQGEDWRFQECGGCVCHKDTEDLKDPVINSVLDIDSDLEPYCKGCESNNWMGVNGAQYTFEFPNGYSASVTKSYGSYGWNMDLWEVALMVDGELKYLNDFEWDVIGNLDDEGVNAILKKVMNYEEVK